MQFFSQVLRNDYSNPQNFHWIIQLHIDQVDFAMNAVWDDISCKKCKKNFLDCFVSMKVLNDMFYKFFEYFTQNKLILLIKIISFKHVLK